MADYHMKFALNSKARRGAVVFLFVFVLSYVFTSVSVWTTDSRFITVSRFIRVYGHENLVRGTGYAPEQYRFGGFYLVENFFKYIPLKWYDVYNSTLSDLLISEEAWTEEMQKTVDKFFPQDDREKMIGEIQRVIDETLESFFPGNALVQNLLRGMIDGLQWQSYLTNIEETLPILGEMIPENIRNHLLEDSEEARLVNGYFTSRFFLFMILLTIIYFLCREFLKPFQAMCGVVLFAALVPFALQDFLQAETVLSLVLFSSMLLLTKRDGSRLVLFFVTILCCTARTDHALFGALIYGLMHGIESLRRRQWLRALFSALLLIIPVAATVLISGFLFPEAEYYVDLIQFEFNMTHIWSWIFPLILLLLPIVFFSQIKHVEFYRKTWPWIPLFVAANFVVGKTAEVRLFLPLVIYSIPLVIGGMIRSLAGEEDLTDGSEV